MSGRVSMQQLRKSRAIDARRGLLQYSQKNLLFVCGARSYPKRPIKTPSSGSLELRKDLILAACINTGNEVHVLAGAVARALLLYPFRTFLVLDQELSA